MKGVYALKTGRTCLGSMIPPPPHTTHAAGDPNLARFSLPSKIRQQVHGGLERGSVDVGVMPIHFSRIVTNDLLGDGAANAGVLQEGGGGVPQGVDRQW